MGEQPIDLAMQCREICEIHETNCAPADFVLIGRTNSAFGRANDGCCVVGFHAPGAHAVHTDLDPGRDRPPPSWPGIRIAVRADCAPRAPAPMARPRTTPTTPAPPRWPWPAGRSGAGRPRGVDALVRRAGDGPARAGSAARHRADDRGQLRRASRRRAGPSPPAPRPPPARRRASRPTPSAARRAPPRAPRARAAPTTSPIPRTTLSAVPNVEAAKSLSHAGVASTNADPTATSGSVLGPVSSATSEPTPRVTAPAASPASAASTRCPDVQPSAACLLGGRSAPTLP